MCSNHMTTEYWCLINTIYSFDNQLKKFYKINDSDCIVEPPMNLILVNWQHRTVPMETIHTQNLQFIDCNIVFRALVSKEKSVTWQQRPNHFSKTNSDASLKHPKYLILLIRVWVYIWIRDGSRILIIEGESIIKNFFWEG